MIRKPYIFYFCLILILFTSCSKTSTSNTTTSTPTPTTPTSCGFQSSSFVGTWKLTKVTARNMDYTAQYLASDSCYKSTRITYNSNNSYAYSNVNPGCNPNNNSGIFSLYTANSKNYLVHKSRYNDTIQITAITCTTYDVYSDSVTYQYSK